MNVKRRGRFLHAQAFSRLTPWARLGPTLQLSLSREASTLNGELNYPGVHEDALS